MPYSKQQNEYNKEYVREHQKQIMIKYKNEYYEKIVLPAIKKSGLPSATFIKQAIDEKIKRDHLDE